MRVVVGEIGRYMFTSSLYRSAPVLIQEALISGRAWVRKTLREGASFRRVLADVRDTQWLDAMALGDYQSKQLHALLEHAASSVPFYRDHVDPSKLRGMPPREALSLFPVIDKEIVRGAGDSMLSARASRPLIEGTTSGTTGSPLRLKQDLTAINREHAFIHRQLEWAGFRPGDRRAWIRGDLVVDGRTRNAPYWRRNPVEAMLMMSSFHLSAGSAPQYLSALALHDPHLIQAYPSSIGFLAGYLRTVGASYEGKSLRGIVTSSESLDPETRVTIEHTFGCQVFDWYGLSERVAAVGTCEHHGQHLVMDYSFVELESRDQGLHELVGTGFNNYAMPLIRYRTGDSVKLSRGSQCKCGRSFPLVERVQGRADDCIKLPDGRIAGRLDRVFNGATGIVEGQIIQDKPGQVDVCVVPGPGFSRVDEEALVQALRDRVGSDLEIHVRQVASLTRTRSGKLRNVICTI
ncbi:phenylacetate--CoA ligase family protein [Lysobacter arenosi]|uniref:Phenylacetate--CoA ligase family protein n=1 Tax=Lysobacter arenosi TaxID=2795387 RepID=A0ABX7REC7_9GAMM|nr:phenylacetate--CoA ligase family protein [Lysobacter arenosi]QSX76045.1 phenylacetate--CoA ligase family protein [Lysobacter arenosi]